MHDYTFSSHGMHQSDANAASGYCFR